MKDYIYTEVLKAIAALKVENKVEQLTDDEQSILFRQIEDLYVLGNPRAWWLSFKHKPTNFIFNDEMQYKRISNFFDDNEKVYFIIETDTKKLALITIAGVIVDIIKESPFFEYYILDMDLYKMLCETDHGDLLHIDLSKIKSK